MIRVLYVGTDDLADRIANSASTAEPIEVLTVSTCQQAKHILQREAVGFLLLQVEYDDCNLCSYVRIAPATSELPIICLGADQEQSTVLWYFQMGTDDFVSIPFDTEELIARVYAVNHRVVHGSDPQTVMRVAHGQIDIDVKKQEVRVSDAVVTLTRLEYLVLYHLARIAGRPLSLDEFLVKIWGYHPQTGDPSLVRAQVRNLRRKLERHGGRDWIETVPGIGYQVVA